MNVLVIGAAVRTGKAVVEQALAAGHQVLSVGESKANAPFYERLLATYLHGADKDKAAMAAAVKESDLGWVVLRPAILTDDPAQGHARVFEAATAETAHKITRADLATFMVAQLTSYLYLRQTVTIANR